MDLDAEEIHIGLQTQRINGQFPHRETNTDASDAALPLVGIRTAALMERQKEQDAAGEWADTGLVFTTRNRTGRTGQERTLVDGQGATDDMAVEGRSAIAAAHAGGEFLA